MIIAQKSEANIVVANYFIKADKNKERIPIGDMDRDGAGDNDELPLPAYLTSLIDTAVFSRPEIIELDISDMDEVRLAAVINLNHIWMIVKGVPTIAPAAGSTTQLNIQTVLNKVLCPLLLIPVDWRLKAVERLVHVADLRYCRLEVVRYLAELARPWNASISIAHMSASGLPDMA